MRLVVDVQVQTGGESETAESVVVMLVGVEPFQMSVVIELGLPG